MWYPELLVPSIVSLVCVLVVTPWHLRLRNLATLSMIFWMGSLDLAHIVNTSVWGNDAINRAPAWCDISAALQVGYNVGLPLSHLLLARQLEGLTSLRSTSVVFDEHRNRRSKILNRCLAFGMPPAVILLHLAAQDRRFYVIQGTGCFPATYWDAYGLILMAVVPVLIAFLAAIYTGVTFWNLYQRRCQLKSIVSDTSSITKDNFVRLYVLGCAEIGTCLLRAFFNLTSYLAGPQPLNHMGEPHHNLTEVGTLAKDVITAATWRTQLLQWYTVTACSMVFFLCFATGSENMRFYRDLAHAMFPRWVASSRGVYDSARSGASSSGAPQSKPNRDGFSSTDKFASELESGIVDPNQVDAYHLDFLKSRPSEQNWTSDSRQEEDRRRSRDAWNAKEAEAEAELHRAPLITLHEVL